MTDLAHTASSLLGTAGLSGLEAARLEAEAQLHVANRRRAVLIVAGAATDAVDCRRLLDMLGLGVDDVRAARPATRRRRRVAAAS